MISVAVERTTIDLGSLNLEVFQVESGDYYLSITQILTAIGINEAWFRTIAKKAPKALEWLQNNGFKEFYNGRIIGEQKARQVKLLTIEDTCLVWSYFANNGNSKAISLLKAVSCHPEKLKLPKSFKVLASTPSAIKKENKRLKQVNKTSVNYSSPEKKVENKLAKSIKGSIQQVMTLVGTIDILTLTEVIEVKAVTSWKAALGQVLVYGGQYPSHTMRLHLFGSVRSDMRELIEKECQRFHVRVTWESDITCLNSNKPVSAKPLTSIDLRPLPTRHDPLDI